MKLVSFSVLMQLLRDRDLFLEEINHSKKLDRKILSLLFCSSLFLALYGAIIGSVHGWLQMLSSAFKLPALYLITLLICLPTLYFLDIFYCFRKIIQIAIIPFTLQAPTFLVDNVLYKEYPKLPVAGEDRETHYFSHRLRY